MDSDKINIFWFRRDLRLEDNVGLFHALSTENKVLPLFIFDKDILEKLEDKNDKRVSFIYQTIISLKKQLEEMGSTLLVKYGHPTEVWKEIITSYNINSVYCSHDYEPYAIQRDLAINNLLNTSKISFLTFKDQCIFEKSEVVKDDGKPYTVFTPYSKKWLALLATKPIVCVESNSILAKGLIQTPPMPIIPLQDMGFNVTHLAIPPLTVEKELLLKYAQKRDIPSESGTSRLSVHLRFGTISIRKLALMGNSYSATWLNELIWRDFYMMILYHFPHVVHGSFKRQYDNIKWLNNKIQFERWCTGQTGYPIVDAGMRELNATGFMHNRVRMIVASFLVKHLLIDWRWGEAYFASKLLDFDLSANNGGWQWAAGSGCDAAPYFRVFNPYLQTEKFDPQLKYVKKWVPEFQEFTYPQPIVKHELARNRALEVYKQGLQEV